MLCLQHEKLRKRPPTLRAERHHAETLISPDRSNETIGGSIEFAELLVAKRHVVKRVDPPGLGDLRRYSELLVNRHRFPETLSGLQSNRGDCMRRRYTIVIG